MKKTVILTTISVLVVLSNFLLKSITAKNPGDNNPMDAIIQTGRYLFFDTRLSHNNTKSCGSCHDPKFAFTDGYRRSITSNGDNVKHNAPSLINISFQHYFDWANPGVTSLEQQHERPLFNQNPVELGVKGNERIILQRLKGDHLYQQLFGKSFPLEKNPVSIKNIIYSIAAFVKTLQSKNSAYDKFMAGDSTGLSSSAKNGMNLFFSPQLNCSGCHPAPYFTMATATFNTDSIYFNTGLYNILNNNTYPVEDIGLASITHQPADDGKFKVPSLRNVALTAPYMHDGSMSTLEEIIEMYARGGRNFNGGDGKNNMYKDKRINGFSITATEKKDLVNFLFSLTDSTILTNPCFRNPF